MAGVSGGGDRKGRIPDRDIAAIREKIRIEDVVGDYVQLRRAGADSLKGLCPFHDEKSPSFHVRPNHGHFHCFGCGEGGDVYAFIQKIEHVSFVEAVEMLADRIGHTVSYSGGGTSVQRDRGSRSRLIAANAAAQEFYAAALESDEAAPARKYLTERNFDAAAARKFGCGFAPSGWDKLTKHLISKGFEFKELEAAGLSREGRRGPMDRFHRRLLWPIRTASGFCPDRSGITDISRSLMKGRLAAINANTNAVLRSPVVSERAESPEALARVHSSGMNTWRS